jgi:hypothetical protein
VLEVQQDAGHNGIVEAPGSPERALVVVSNLSPRGCVSTTGYGFILFAQTNLRDQFKLFFSVSWGSEPHACAERSRKCFKSRLRLAIVYLWALLADLISKREEWPTSPPLAPNTGANR